MDERDFGIAVRDALRIDKCYDELWRALAERPALNGDELHYFSRFSMVPHDEDVVHARNSRDLAIVIIREAASLGEFAVWIRTADTDETVDPTTLVNVDNRSWSKGTYRVALGATSFLQGRPLWVKTIDWNQFCQQLIERRHGVAAGYGIDPTTAEPDKFEQIQAWPELEMAEAIRACAVANREDAWRTIFKARKAEHGWDVNAFRQLWPVARGTKGMTGRPPKRA